MDKSKIDNVASHIEKYGHITPKEAYELYGSMRLAAIICVLRKRGWDIKTNMISRGTPHGVVTYARYEMEVGNGQPNA